MKLIQYAFASTSYYKKDSVLLGLFFAGFMFALTFVFDLISTFQMLFQQVNQNIWAYPELSYYSFIRKQFISIDNYYRSLLLIVLPIFLILAFLLVKLILDKRVNEFTNWRLLGFSNQKIWGLAFAEIIVPCLMAAIAVLSIVIVFQGNYQESLQAVHSNRLGLKLEGFTHEYSLDIFLGNNHTIFILPKRMQHLFELNINDDLFLLSTIDNLIKSCGLAIVTLILPTTIWQLVTFKKITKVA
ncbi:hypothetical protein M2139_002591 [Enterococcus sp. PF1-24]|uniref:hypothetical protein n=1 Tax=unclassified Enterococcus TaxID=2608891 RepID=UPI00247486FF|nr:MULTISPECIES: hypothetical protein [unclassified Enterococcus]MDH6365598.1 hypothetical protein [Enterococcus sp. PFB1-1]MDH6402686.1 hypothetical protein [Enterococcus sp. PF1-24]